jgi:addiction module HigA family antidote
MTMRMKNPVHPGELVKANLEELGLSVVEAAKAIRVTRQQLYNVIGGKSAVTPEMAVRFEKAFGGSADMWLRMQAACDLARVRQHEKEIVVNRLAASPPSAAAAARSRPTPSVISRKKA